jgi:spore photoproduct lyase
MPSIEHIRSFVNEKFETFGKNKRQDVIRLLHEITKRDACNLEDIFQDAPESINHFFNLKKFLLAKRFPDLTEEERGLYHSLPEVNINLENCVLIKEKLEIPCDNFYVENSVLNTDLVKRLKNKFKQATFSTIKSYKDHVSKAPYGLIDYNNRLQKVFIVREQYDFFPKCPCTPHAIPCGYYLMNMGMGCPYECSYCFLQSYVNSPGIIIPANIDDFFKQFKQYLDHNMRLGTGELTDSLVYDPITEYSPIIIEFFRNYPNSVFEFKTKSTNIQLILSTPPADNIIISWSLNPQKIIDENEFYTASLHDRLSAAKECVKSGYKVGFHFDPIIYYPGWEDNYRDVVNRIFELIDPKSIAWISLGTLRMTLKQKTIIENRFPSNTILDRDLIPGYDEKLRYPARMRIEIYKKMLAWINKYSSRVPIYLCMEDKNTYDECQLPVSFKNF